MLNFGAGQLLADHLRAIPPGAATAGPMPTVVAARFQVPVPGGEALRRWRSSTEADGRPVPAVPTRTAVGQQWTRLLGTVPPELQPSQRAVQVRRDAAAGRLANLQLAVDGFRLAGRRFGGVAVRRG